MCPKNEGLKSVNSDCGIDEERCGSLSSIPCEDSNVIGYRHDPTAGGACETLRKFSEKVSLGEVFVGDCDNKTRLLERFAGGSFGELYTGEITDMDNKKVAVKVEPGQGMNFLLQEGNVYRNLENGPGIPKVYWFGYHGSDYRALVMDLLGPTVEDLFAEYKRKFSLKTVLLIADQMVDILQYVHSQNYVHRDISPSNIVLGGDGNETHLFLIDFGHAKKFNETFRMFRRPSVALPRAVVGTPRFISVHAHLSHPVGPRDDLESLCYILLYLARGNLPWQGIRANNMPEKLNKIYEMKISTSIDTLCQGLPEEFGILLNYVRKLELYTQPDYDGIKGIFRTLAAKLDIEYDCKFDWHNDVEEDNIERQQASSLSIPTQDSVADDRADSPNVTPISR